MAGQWFWAALAAVCLVACGESSNMASGGQGPASADAMASAIGANGASRGEGTAEMSSAAQPGGRGESGPEAESPAAVAPAEASAAGQGAEVPLVPGNEPQQQPPGASVEFDYVGEEVALDSDLVIAAGTILRVGPGTTFSAGAGVKVQVEGQLLVEGSAQQPVRFDGGGLPNSWHGIVIADGGEATLTHIEIGGATFGIHAMPGSDFAVDYAEIGTSFKAAVVQSDGSFDHTRFHASGEPTFSAVNEVSIDDVNGTLTIIDSSPVVTNSSFDGSFALVDMIRVGGDSSPRFDHIKVIEAHCGIHASGGVNSTPIVTNSIFEGLAYGLMAYTTAPSVEGTVFRDNGADVGYCFGATDDNRPSLQGNYYSNGEPLVDASCFQIGTVDDSPAAAADPAAGPMGL